MPRGNALNSLAQQTVYIDGQTGSNTLGNGSAMNPWATLTFAYSQISDNATGKRYTLMLSGAVTESVAVKPWTSIVGRGPQESTITGTLSLDASWTTVNGTFSLTDLFVTEVDFDSSAMGGGTFPNLFFSGVKI